MALIEWAKLKPVELQAVDVAFGAAGKLDQLLPPLEAIPKEFLEDRNEMVKVVNLWFYGGLSPETEFVPREGIDHRKALIHIRACLGSFEPKHERKIAGCAWLLHLWFSEIKVPNEPRAI